MFIIDGGTPWGLPTESPLSGIPLEDILTICQQQIQDISGDKWEISDLLAYAQLGILEIINIKPNAYPQSKDLDLVKGPIQNLPTGSFLLLDVVCNLINGTTPGDTVSIISKSTIDSILPGWMSYAASSNIKFVIYDKEDPYIYYVFPPQPDSPSNKLRAVLSIAPEVLDDIDDLFPLVDAYQPAIVNYVIYRALAEETTIPNALNKSQIFYGNFFQSLGLKANVEQKVENKAR